MKKALKISSCLLVSIILFLLAPVNTMAASNTQNNSLTTGQVIGGIILLIATIFVPIVNRLRKTGAR